jgi:hypothetical protein
VLEKISAVLKDEKTRDLALVAGGMVGIMTGAKLVPLTLFAVGARGVAKRSVEDTPELRGASFSQRWERAIAHYDATHQNQVNRALHTIGIPMILGGTLGLLALPRYTPPWWIANGSYATGWALNFVGHAFEQSAPAFATDPLSFIAGPVWDYVRMKDAIVDAIRGEEPKTERAPESTAAVAE